MLCFATDNLLKVKFNQFQWKLKLCSLVDLSVNDWLLVCDEK